MGFWDVHGRDFFPFFGFEKVPKAFGVPLMFLIDTSD